MRTLALGLGLFLGGAALAEDWPDANRVALHMACTASIAPEIASDTASQLAFCSCFTEQMQDKTTPEVFEAFGEESQAVMNDAIQTCKLELLASALTGGVGSERFKMDEGDKASLRDACVSQRTSEGKTGDNQAHCKCSIDYIATRWTLADMVMGDMQARLNEADRACEAAAPQHRPEPDPEPEPEPEPFPIGEPDEGDLPNINLRAHYASDLPPTGTRTFSWGLSVGTHVAGRLSVGVQLQRERWIDLEVWRIELQPDYFLWGKWGRRGSITLDAVGGLGTALGGNGFGASVGAQVGLRVNLSDKFKPGAAFRVAKPFGYNASGNAFRLNASYFQISVGKSF